jgi:predicted nucleic acid-binding protein
LTEDTGARRTPLVLDVTVLTAIVRGDTEVTSLILGYDQAGQPLVIPVLAFTAASLDMRTDEAEDLLAGLEQLGNVMTAPLRDAEQAVRLAAVIARTGLDAYDAHVAAVADAAICPVLTLEAAKWRPHLRDLDEQPVIVEIADPDEN